MHPGQGRGGSCPAAGRVGSESFRCPPTRPVCLGSPESGPVLSNEIPHPREAREGGWAVPESAGHHHIVTKSGLAEAHPAGGSVPVPGRPLRGAPGPQGCLAGRHAPVLLSGILIIFELFQKKTFPFCTGLHKLQSQSCLAVPVCLPGDLKACEPRPVPAAGPRARAPSISRGTLRRQDCLQPVSTTL